MKPFLLLASREEDRAADAEYEAFLRYGALTPEELHRVRMEAAPLPAIRLSDYSGVIVGGSPFNSTDPDELKSATQHRVEAELTALLDEITNDDFPFLGACYGIAALSNHRGGSIDTTYGEPVGAVLIELTAAGRADPLLAELPETFSAFVGHKEACRVLPEDAVLLATSSACPVQMFRIGQNVYATQFHPELDADGLITRIAVYDRHGYFPPDQAEAVASAARRADVSHAPGVLRAFVHRYAQD
ncbi:MAG TPA: glutamine amidotransferase [Candidatus Ruania gallistercoris]|uniref:Glutamine amidotransferase n=1 Tax=Candidatus Ruania gallistercoris TaxID=2838746 RepID=A0A9D2EAV5_9MICO|nr:glutamine amidotransferase [Candidatus Ruania gallistercoris]